MSLAETAERAAADTAEGSPFPNGSVPSARTGGWQLWLGIAFSVACLYLALRDANLIDVASALGQVHPGWVAFAAVTVVVTFIAKAARWRLLLATLSPPRFRRALAVLSIGMLLNSFMPARLGDLARAYLMGEAEAQGKTYVLGTIALEKLVDLALLVVSSLLLLTQMPFPNWLSRPTQVTAAMVALSIPVLVLLAWRGDVALRLVGKLTSLVPSGLGAWLRRQAALALRSLTVLRHPSLTARLGAWSLVIWFLGALTNYIVLLAVGLSVPAWTSVLLLVVLQAGVAVPSSPGRIGVFHYLTVLTLSLLGVDKELSVLYAIVLHLVVYVPMVVVGIASLWHEEITWQKLGEGAARLGQLAGKLR